MLTNLLNTFGIHQYFLLNDTDQLRLCVPKLRYLANQKLDSIDRLIGGRIKLANYIIGKKILKQSAKHIFFPAKMVRHQRDIRSRFVAYLPHRRFIEALRGK
ncbi:hypothetical protein D3C79_923310 [compost metagenome]